MIEVEHSEQNQNGVLPCAVRRHQHKHNVNNRYEFIKTLGKGTYGKVKLARQKETNQLVAVKAISKDKVKDSSDMRHIRREMEIMSSIRHPHIIQIYEVFENEDKIVIVMEYADGGELYDYLSTKHDSVTEAEARVFFRQIVSAVQYCHEQGIVHRDLKLENILLDKERRIKIADFGLANCFKPDSYLHTFCGSPLYASPEIVCGVPYRGPEVDSWSLGVLLYALLYGSMPFDGRNHQMLVKQITSGVFTKPPKHSVAHELVCWLLTVDPLNRATINDVAAHWWVKSDLSAPVKPQSKLERKGVVQDKPLQTVPSRVPFQQSSTPKSILKKVNGILGTRPRSEPATPITAESLANQLAAVCGLNAKDSLTLRTSSAPQKRRMIRCRRDRESGYYSSPERAAYEKVNVSEPTLYINGLYLQASAHTPLADRSSWPSTGGVYYSTGGTIKHRFTSLSSDDGSTVSSQIRPPSAHSDSSFISTDSCDVNSLDAANPVAQFHATQRPMTLSVVPDTLPPLDKKFLDEQAPGSLTPKSEKLVRDLERILAPTGRRRRRQEVVDKEYLSPKTNSFINHNLDICSEVVITDT